MSDGFIKHTFTLTCEGCHEPIYEAFMETLGPLRNATSQVLRPAFCASCAFPGKTFDYARYPKSLSMTPAIASEESRDSRN